MLYLSLEVIFSASFEGLTYGTELHFAFTLSYFFLFLLQVLVGLGGNIEPNARVYHLCMIAYGSLMVRMVFLCGHAHARALDCVLMAAASTRRHYQRCCRCSNCWKGTCRGF